MCRKPGMRPAAMPGTAHCLGSLGTGCRAMDTHPLLTLQHPSTSGMEPIRVSESLRVNIYESWSTKIGGPKGAFPLLVRLKLLLGAKRSHSR